MTKFLTILAFFASIISCDKPVTSNKTTILVAFEDTSQAESWGFKDTSGQIVIPAEYSMVFGDSFINDITFVVKKSDGKDDSETGIIAIDKRNKFILKPFIFDNGPDYLQDGLFRFTENDKMGFADINGKKVIPAKYTFVESFEEGFSAFCEGCKKENMGEHWRMAGGKWGFMDKNGKEILAAEYDEVSNFKDGVAEVTKKGEKMRINPKGEVVK
jgi:WG containing repeat